MKRIFIEVDDEKESADIIGTVANFTAASAGIAIPADSLSFFDQIIYDAGGNAMDAWEAIKSADEIYMSTYISPRWAGSDFGAPMLFNIMMYKAIEENITGKSIYIFNEYRSIHWDNIKGDYVDKAFRKNFLYTLDKDRNNWEQVDIDKLIKEEY